MKFDSSAAEVVLWTIGHIVMNEIKYMPIEHIEAKTKWRQFCRRHFQMHFPE